MIGTVGRSETVTREMSVPHANRPVYAGNMNFPSTSSIVSSAMVESVPEAQLDRPSAPSPVASGSWQVHTAVDVPHVQVAHVAKIEAKDTKGMCAIANSSDEDEESIFHIILFLN